MLFSQMLSALRKVTTAVGNEKLRKIRMIYTLEKKTQRERLNEQLRYSLDSREPRIRNGTFFLKFKTCLTAIIVLF